MINNNIVVSPYLIENTIILLLFVLLSALIVLILYWILRGNNKYEILKNKYTFFALFFVMIGVLFGNTQLFSSTAPNSFMGSLGASFVILGIASFSIEYLLLKEFLSIINAVKNDVSIAIETSTINYSHGVIVHPNHDNIIARKDAINKYLLDNGTFRIISPNGDKYFQKGCDGRSALENKISKNNCKIKALLYLPVFDFDENHRIGPNHSTPERIMNEHKTLKEDYFDLLKKYPGKVEIKYCTLPIHLNVMIIGKERAFSALIMQNHFGRKLPCFEMFPAGNDSLFHKVFQDFEFIYNSQDPKVVLSINEVYKIYEDTNYDQNKIRELFLARK